VVSHRLYGVQVVSSPTPQLQHVALRQGHPTCRSRPEQRPQRRRAPHCIIAGSRRRVVFELGGGSAIALDWAAGAAALHAVAESGGRLRPSAESGDATSTREPRSPRAGSPLRALAVTGAL
jgi:hypothetical protein